MGRVEERLEREVIEAYFNDEPGGPRIDPLQMASQLQWILVALCTGPASTCLRRETATNGFESRWQLVHKYKVPTKARAVERLSKILKPIFWDKTSRTARPTGRRRFISTSRRRNLLFRVL